ncbi:MAG TPA: amino acid adenylation domain-containing protein [Longimicrobium sp.]|jgi:amino acid adenylation domain-containing protein|uniref:amino acid adenylation domain-containing protein n=1 Tax=Longimicrobium sp. TaxID=2029185 RepID=UPI002EDA6126
MSRNQFEDLYPLSPLQHGMLFHALYAPEAGAYVEQWPLLVEGALDEDAFHRALGQVVQRHPALRTGFVWEGVPKPLQVVFRQAEVKADRRDWTDAVSEEEWRTRLNAWLAEDRRRGFDLKAAPLVRLAFLRVRADAWVVVFTFHHILIDAWAAGIVLADWFTFYRAEQTGEPVRLPPAPRYRDYIGWLQRRDEPAAEAFWRGALDGFGAPTPLPWDQGGAEVAEQHAAHRLVLDAVDSARLQGFAREQALTLNTVVQGAWGLLLARLADTDDVVFGTTVSGRPADLPGVERIVGLFINTLPVRVRIPQGATVREWLGELQRWQAEARQHEHTPLVDVQRWTGIPRERPLFGSLAVFENAPPASGGDGEGGEAALRVTGLPMVEGSTFPLTLVIVPGERLELRLAYDTRRFSADAARRMLDGLAVLLAGLPGRADAPVASLSLVTENDRREFEAWGRGAAAEDALPVHLAVEAHAARTPYALALVAGTERLAYAELNRRANRVARRLVALAAGPEARVAVCVERSADLVVGMLAVLKAGACYVPLDPAYPAERLAYMAADSGAAVLLVSRDAPVGLRERVPAVLSFAADAGSIAAETDGDLGSDVHPLHLAYALYTSGSTGLPKGVMVAHADAAAHARAAADVYALAANDRVLQFASASFDPAMEQILAPLTAGAAIVMRGAEVPSPLELVDLVRAEGVTVVNPPTAYWHELVRDAAACESLRATARLVLAGGEAMNPAEARRWLATPGQARLLNVYGPAETVITSTVQEVDARAADLPGAVSVGRPFPGRRAYVLRPDGSLAAPGEPGELFIGGLLARGYLDRPALTAERFVPDAFSATPGARLYATGDRARWTEDGRLAFLGRADHQVKVRGIRVEPGEIEGALVALPPVADAAVVAREDGRGGRSLVAYVAPSPGCAPSAAELRRALEAALPEFMVPSAFVLLDALPMTPGGKVDRLALPAIERTETGVDARPYTAPRTETEVALSELWADVLGIARVGADDSFFSLGGHSLSAMQVTSRIRQRLDVEVPLRVIFEAPTLAALAARVDGMRAPADGGPRLERALRGDTAPLSFAQERIWFLERLLAGSPVYNIPVRVELRGTVNPEALRGALDDLVRRHEPLRTTLAERNGAAVQVIHPPARFDLPLTDLSHLPEAEAHREAERMAAEAALAPFDFAAGPLFRAHLIRHGASRWMLLMEVHHAVADGWSMGVFYTELSAFYEARLRGVRAALPPLAVQYADYAEWQRAWLTGERLEAQLAYWRERLAGAPSVDLPSDRPRPAASGFGGASLGFAVPAEAAANVRELGRTEEVTLFMPLLAALHLLLWKYTGETDHTVGSLVAGRTRAETEGLIGMFVNTLPLRTALTPDITFRELVRRVRETTLDAHAHQDLPFERLVDELGVERSLSRHPVFQVAFTVEERPHGQAWRLGDATAVQPDSGTGTSKFDLTVGFTPVDDALFGGMEYATELFDEATVRRMAGHLVDLLAAAVADPDRPLRALPGLLRGEARRTLLAESGSAAEVPDAPVHVLFARQAARTPHAPALLSGGSVLSYSELEARANGLAHHLRARGAGAESVVALIAARAPETIVTVLAVLKAGAAYLPLDPALPAARVEEMLGDAGARWIVDPDGSGAFATAGVARIDLLADAAAIATQPDTDPATDVHQDGLAYLIYTSGSTGRPKAVAVPHRGVGNLALSSARRLQLGAGDRMLHFTSLAFDVSVSELFATLLSGAALVVAPREALLPGQPLAATLRTERITVLHAAPSALAVTDAENLPHLRAVLAGGEALSAAVAGRWGRGRRLVNGYGPTEATVYATTAVVDADDPAPSIGTAVPNARVYVLDPLGDPLPAGIYGELHVGGMGVVRGYLNRPALTAERFIPDAFSATPGARLYRTGDRVRWGADAQLHYAGRMDDQVKIRGFRVEPGEAAAQLAALPGVGDAVAVARADAAGDHRLVAYVTPSDGAEPPRPEALRSMLARTLPDYLVPSVIVVLDTLPRTPNGKVDRRSLPAPAVQGSAYVEPRTETERVLAEIWSGLLGVERVGAEDAFFALGGHSLMATRMVSAIRERLQVDLPLRDVFETPRLDQLAARLDEALDPSLSALLEDLDDLSDEDLRALLQESAAPGAEF